jgi:hypothetical protein
MKKNHLNFSSGVIEAPVFRNLTSEQRRALLARMYYVIELCDKLDSSKNALRGHYLIQEIELDAWVNLGAPENDHEKEISSWLIHTNWASECEHFKPATFLESKLLNGLENTLNVKTPAALNEWLSTKSIALRLAAMGVINAVDICALVAHVMAMNVLLLDLVSCVNRVRIYNKFD